MCIGCPSPSLGWTLSAPPAPPPSSKNTTSATPTPSPPNSPSNVVHGWSPPIRDSQRWGRSCRSIGCRATKSSGIDPIATDDRLRPRPILPTQRQKILRPLDRLGHLPQQFLQVFVAVDEINLRRIHDQQVR